MSNVYLTNHDAIYWLSTSEMQLALEFEGVEASGPSLWHQGPPAVVLYRQAVIHFEGEGK